MAAGADLEAQVIIVVVAVIIVVVMTAVAAAMEEITIGEASAAVDVAG
ncbi:TPA: hypothetical protein ACOTG0_000441 [Clostridium perfringens]